MTPQYRAFVVAGITIRLEELAAEATALMAESRSLGSANGTGAAVKRRATIKAKAAPETPARRVRVALQQVNGRTLRSVDLRAKTKLTPRVFRDAIATLKESGSIMQVGTTSACTYTLVN